VREEKAKYVYAAIVVFILLTSIYVRLFFGPFLFQLPNIVAWSVGGVFFFVGSILFIKWRKLKDEIYKGILVTKGVYEHIRHPHYSSNILMAFGVSFLLQSLLFLLFAILNVIVLNEVARKEEDYLIKTYGAAYNEYMKKVRWRFIPLVM
jgi:protein-S-isoprenylcysteine O-methyltransferase Ste14